jgi:rare lipoprotein A
MPSILKAALLGLAVWATAAFAAEASAPFNPEARQIRAPGLTREMPVLARYARNRASMNDASYDDDERPRARSRKAVRQHAQRAPRAAQRQAYRQRAVRAAAYEEQSWDGEERSQRRRGAVQGKRAERAPGYVPMGAGDSGIASYYWQGQRTASGAYFNPDGLTAAHRTLPFGTRVRVTNLSNGRSVNVTINDRGPFIGGRIIDLSRGAAGVIGMTGQGLARVHMEVLGR